MALLNNLKEHALEAELEGICYSLNDGQRQFLTKASGYASRLSDVALGRGESSGRCDLTIRGLGKPVPSQMFLLQLAGLVIEGRSVNHEPSDEQIEFARNQGYRRLKRLTGEDFGYSVEKWFHFFWNKAAEYGFFHPYGHRTLLSILERRGYKIPAKRPVKDVRLGIAKTNFGSGEFTKRDYVLLMGISPSIAGRELSAAVKEGHLTRQGRGLYRFDENTVSKP